MLVDHSIIMSIITDGNTIVDGGEGDGEMATFDVQRHGGNEWFMDDFPCSKLMPFPRTQKDVIDLESLKQDVHTS